MKEDNQFIQALPELREKAEERLKRSYSIKALPSGEIDLLKLLHEIDVQQVELEMQNEELRLAVEKAETATALYDSAPSGYFTIDTNCTISELNHSGANLLKSERSLLINKDLRYFVSPESLLVFNGFLHKAFETNCKQTCEISLSINFNPLPYVYLEGIVSENSSKCILVAVDITERKQTEEALRKSEAENRIIIEVNPDILFRITKQGFILDYHAPAHTHFYVAPEFFLGKKMTDVLPLDVAQKILDTIAVACQSGKMATMEYELTKDGKREYFENRIVPMFDDELLSFVRDITQRKEAEAELSRNYSLLRIAGETAKFGGWNFDMEENRVTMSDEVAMIYGKPNGFYPTLTEALSFYAPEWVEKITNAVNDCAKKGIPFDEELEIINDAGKRVWVRTIGEAIWNNDGNIVKIQGSFQDISEKKQAEDALRKSEAKFKELNDTKDKFFSIIAHDLRSPFHNVVGFSNLLVRDILEKDYAGVERFANIIQDSSERAMDLLVNLLEWSRSQTGRMEFLPEEIDFGQLLTNVIRLLNDSAENKGISIYTELPDRSFVFADKAMLGTILRNLISNSIKYTKSEGVITVAAKQMNNGLLVSVTDDGVGISSEDISKLFRIEKNHSTAGTQNEKGTGLGLILCREFVEKHGGKIWAESQVGKGSTFYFTIPKM
ncbi:MAG: PAS domain S-box protein [Prolixibacteraceae bacterium]|nr:PAS domain S-box protein [Prolixibacteraceae bacterium]